MVQLTKEKYNEVSFVVRGDTKYVKSQLRDLGGHQISTLKGGAGWIFSTRMHTHSVEKFIQKLAEQCNNIQLEMRENIQKALLQKRTCDYDGEMYDKDGESRGNFSCRNLFEGLIIVSVINGSILFFMKSIRYI
jgi:hypothetical protein